MYTKPKKTLYFLLFEVKTKKLIQWERRKQFFFASIFIQLFFFSFHLYKITKQFRIHFHFKFSNIFFRTDYQNSKIVSLIFHYLPSNEHLDFHAEKKTEIKKMDSCVENKLYNNNLPSSYMTTMLQPTDLNFHKNVNSIRVKNQPLENGILSSIRGAYVNKSNSGSATQHISSPYVATNTPQRPTPSMYTALSPVLSLPLHQTRKSPVYSNFELITRAAAMESSKCHLSARNANHVNNTSENINSSVDESEEEIEITNYDNESVHGLTMNNNKNSSNNNSNNNNMRGKNPNQTESCKFQLGKLD
jgi:hypothetical protein